MTSPVPQLWSAVRILRVPSNFCSADHFLPWCCSDCSGILPAEAELMYINEVERLDGFGQEIFPVKVTHGPHPCTFSNLMWIATGQSGFGFSVSRDISR